MITSLYRQNPRLFWAIAAVLLLLVVAIVVGLFLASRAFAMPPQPLPYSHQVHIAAGVECIYCHPGVDSGPVAGIPSLAKCMGCHLNVDPQDPAAQADVDQLIAKWDAKEPVQWVKINDQPDFVQFNHRPHVAAGVACETCHGDVSQVDYPNRYNHNMGWCLSCHRDVGREHPEKLNRLLDCATCHY
jgi:hypothetical protein